jgi:two-component system, OmpR family, phosphate regulon sensor histidine kinase PhoR
VARSGVLVRARRHPLILAVSVLVLAAGFVLRLTTDDPNNGVLGLYLLPICLMALAWGPAAALLTAGVAFGLFAAWVQIDHVSMNALGYATRILVFFPIAALVGVSARRLSAAREEESSAAGGRRAILETTNEAFIASDRHGVIREWNPAAERIFGWSASEAIGRLLADTVVPPRMRAGYWKGLRTYLETGEGPMLGQRVEIKAVHRDGREIPIELSLWATGEGEDWTSYGFMHDISERKEIERRQETTARHFELSHDLVSTATLDGRFDQLNSRWEAALGWTVEELRGRPFLELVHPDDREGTRLETERLAQGDESVGRNRYLAKDGSWHWLEWSCVGVPAEGRIYAAARDVTDRVDAKAANRRLGAIVESSRDAIYSYTPDGEITSWNSGAERLFGYSAAEATRMSVSDLVPTDRPGDADAALEQAARGEVVQDRETERLGKNGRRLEVSLTVSPVTDPDGNVVGAATIARDISDRKRTWRYLSAQYRATRVLADAPEIGQIGGRVLPIVCDSGRWTCGAYWAASAHGSELRCEATWVAPHVRAPILPVSSGAAWEPRPSDGLDPLGEPVWVTEIEPGSPVPCAEHAALGSLSTALWMPVQTNGRLHGAFEFFDRCERREDKELLSVLTAIASQIGNYVDRKRAEQETERTKNEFLGLVSHELRTPLTSIIGYTELLAEVEGNRLSGQGGRFLEVIRRNAHRELRLVGDLLLLVRIQAGSFAIEPGRTDLRQVVEQAIEAARPTAERHGVELHLQAGAAPECEADAHRLGQVVDNLLTNAIKFSPGGGEVGVRVGRHNGTATIEVQDTGMGIPPDERERLFERLYRAKGATAMQIPGTGLGLSIVKAIVDAHGGAVGVESEEGVGTTFRVELPLRSAKDPRASRRMTVRREP